MDTKSLLYGLIGFFIGGLLVSVAATTFDKPEPMNSSMSQMTADLKNKRGDDFDAAFIGAMLEHHQGAVDMAALANDRARHQEIKTLAGSIMTTQSNEIDMMHGWQANWGYENAAQTQSSGHMGH